MSASLHRRLSWFGTVLGAFLAVSGSLAATAENAATPRVLIIGDSISIGYTPKVRELLAGKADVQHSPGNAAHTWNGMRSWMAGWVRASGTSSTSTGACTISSFSKMASSIFQANACPPHRNTRPI